MKLTIVYDNESTQENLESGWGFACIIEKKSEKILFDTGWDGQILVNNLLKLQHNPPDIDKIILSHNHWDHIGGLPNILEETRNLDVILPKSFSNNLKKEITKRHEITEITKTQELYPGISTTGELSGKFKGTTIHEQSLAIETQKGLVIVTGCSHPGIEKILEKTREQGEIHALIGGFHGFKNYEILKDINLIIPTHCTQNKKEIKKHYPDNTQEVGVGSKITIK